MAQIPLRVSTRPLETGNVIRYPTDDPVGAALAQAGTKVSEVAANWQRTIEQDENLQATLGYDGFRRTVEGKLAEAKETMPANGSGFYDGALKTYQDEQKTFIGSLPKRLQPEYTARTNNDFLTLQTKAAETQLGASREFARVEIGKLHTRLTDDIVANPNAADADKVYDLGLKAIDESRLPDIEKLKARENWHIHARTAEAQARWRNQPEEMAKAFGVPYERVLDRSEWERALVARESSNNPRVVNKLGYAGLYQFGAPRLATVGMYEPGTAENVSDPTSTGGWSGAKWTGTFKISGFPEVKTLNEFLNSPGAQKAAFTAHVAMMDREIAQRGLEQYIGTRVGGVPITREGIYSMIHLGGAAGAQEALQGGGNARDSNGTSVLDYARLAANVTAAGAPEARYAGIPVEQRQRAVAQVEQVRRKEAIDFTSQEATRYGQNINALQTNIANNTATAEDVQKAKSDGWLTDPGDIARLQGAIQRRDSEMATTRQAMTALQTPNFPWNPYSKDHRDMAEAAFTSLGGNMDALQTIVTKTNMVPATAATTLRGALVSGNSQQVQSALQTAANLVIANPNVFTGVDGGKELAAAALTFEHYVTGRGMSADAAVRRFMDEQKPEYQQDLKAKIKKEDLDAIVKKELKPGDIQGAFDALPWIPFTDPQLTFNPEMRQRAMSDYEEAFRDHFMKNGNVATSKHLAQQEMRVTWGVTTINGARTVMKYPPDAARAYAGIEDVPGSFAKQAQDAIREWNGAEVPRSRIVISEARDTGRRFINGEPPTYTIGYFDQSGVFQMAPKPFYADPERMRSDQTAQREASYARATDVMRRPLRSLTDEEFELRKQIEAAKPPLLDPAAAPPAEEAREVAARRVGMRLPVPDDPTRPGLADRIGDATAEGVSGAYDWAAKWTEERNAERRERLRRLYRR